MKKILFIAVLALALSCSLSAFAADPRIIIGYAGDLGASIEYGDLVDNIDDWGNSDECDYTTQTIVDTGDYTYVSDYYLLLMIDGTFIPHTNCTIKNGRTLVPLRIVSSNLGASVDWNGSTRTAVVSKDGKTIKLTIGNNMVDINGQKIQSDASPEIINSLTYVPIRLIGEAFGAEVGYCDAFTDKYENFPIVWINTNGTPKISEQQALDLCEDYFFNTFIPTAEDIIMANYDVDTKQLTPQNYRQLMEDGNYDYDPKITNDLGQYYFVTLIHGAGGARLLVDKYSGELYTVGSSTFIFLEIAKDSYHVWSLNMYQ